MYSLTGWKIGWENVWLAMLGTYDMTGGKMFFRPAGCLKHGGHMENARNSTNRGPCWTLAGRVTSVEKHWVMDSEGVTSYLGGGVVILPVASWFGNQDKLRLHGLLGSSTELLFSTRLYPINRHLTL